MHSIQTLRKWGNGTGLRLPKEVLQAADLKADQRLEITLRGRSLVLTPVDAQTYPTLQALLKDVSPAMVAGEYQWGEAAGAEVYE